MTCYNCQKTGHLAKNCTQGKPSIIQERELSAITAKRRDILLVNVLNKKNLATRILSAITATRPVIWQRLALVKLILLRPEGVIFPIYLACKMQKNILYIIYHVNVGLL